MIYERFLPIVTEFQSKIFKDSGLVEGKDYYVDKKLPMIYAPSETTIHDMLTVLFPHHQHKKAARTAVEFFIYSFQNQKDPHADMATLRGFVDFMIEKGYN